MKIRYQANLCAGVFSILLGLVLGIVIPRQIGQDYSTAYGITSRSIPYAIVVLFIVCGIALLVQSLVFKNDYQRELILKKEAKAVCYMLILLVYAFLFTRGFILATVFLGVATLAFTGSRKKLYYGIMIIVVAALYLIFTQLLHVRLP